MPMYNLIGVYSKTSGSLWQYGNDIPAIDYSFEKNNIF